MAWVPETPETPESAIRDDRAQLPEIRNDDALWSEFRDRVEKLSRHSIARSDAPDIAERLEWTWVEDPSSLDAASTAALRVRFRAWTAGEVARQPGDYQPTVIPRFRYFIKVGQDALDSLTEWISHETHWSDDAFVKFVDGNWEPLAESEQDGEHEDDEWEKEVVEPIEGCTEEDVGWMRITPHMISADFYDVLSGDENQWITFYERPPCIVKY